MPERASADPFALLGLPRRFDVDHAAVQRAYLARAARVHPDVSGMGEEESQGVQATLNEAMGVLLDAERRANVLLELLGGPGKEQDKSLPPGFLMQIMETREEIDSALASKDPVQRDQWARWASQERERYSTRVAKLFERAMGGETSVLAAIRCELNAWRYIERLAEQLDPSYNPAKADFRR